MAQPRKLADDQRALPRAQSPAAFRAIDSPRWTTFAPSLPTSRSSPSSRAAGAAPGSPGRPRRFGRNAPAPSPRHKRHQLSSEAMFATPNPLIASGLAMPSPTTALAAASLA
ncbi:hypothetical protein H7U32_09505, partial [Bifidobacterium pullorum subsp. saeculare]|nr:hypothetical protein [Bifidobacterium pullorum subsp. saeculare]